MLRTVNKVKFLNGRRCYVLADVIIFVYEVPCIFWHYINVDEVSWITLKTLLQSAMELLQIATASFITKCDGLLLQIATAFLLQSATRFITNCDRYYKVRWIYYKSRQVLQSAKIITNCDSTPFPKIVSFLFFRFWLFWRENDVTKVPPNLVLVF